MSARDDLIHYAASTRTVTADGLAPYIDRLEAEVRQRAARRVWAEKSSEPPEGWSERYVAGWNDALDAATDKIRDEG